MLQSLVVRSHGAVQQGQDEALQRAHGALVLQRIESLCPLLLTGSKLLVVWRFGREAGDAEDEIELRYLVVTPDLFGIRHELFVNAKESRLMEDWEEWRPLLEEDVDTTVREEAG